MNYQAKITPTGTDLLKAAKAKEIPIDIPVELPEPAIPEEVKPDQPLKVALIGTAPSSRMLAPFNDPTWQIWVCSPGNMGAIPKVDIWFELHSNLLWPECKSYGEPYVNWLKQQKFPLYMQDQSLCPNALTFPKDDMIKEFGKYFFTSSFAWMMAFAITKGAKEISLFGVDMASKDEYILQRPGGYYFMHEASRRGIKVSIPMESDMMQPPPLYGYSEVTPIGRKLHVRKQEINDRISQMAAERDKLSHNITYLQGAAEDMEYVQNIWSGAQS